MRILTIEQVFFRIAEHSFEVRRWMGASTGCVRGNCAACRARTERDVYVSRGGDVYHRTPRCWAFRWGQEMAGAALQNTYDIECVTKLHALGLGRTPCLACYFPTTAASAA